MCIGYTRTLFKLYPLATHLLSLVPVYHLPMSAEITEIETAYDSNDKTL
jgi:hypothetical protein